MTTPMSFQLIITNFHLYLIQLWWRFFQFFFFTRHSLCSNLGGIDHEKPYRATLSRVSLAAVVSVITHTKNSCDYHVSRLLHSRFLCLHATLLPTNWGKICIFLKPPYSSVFDHVGVQSVFKDRCKEFI